MALLHLTIALRLDSKEARRTMTGGRWMIGLAAAGVLALGLTGAAQAATLSRHHHHHAPVPPLTADDPGLKSAAAYVVDQGDSSVWYAHNASVASPIASITKL